MRIEEQTFQLNIRVLGETAETARIQIEEMDPMTKDQMWEFLIRACKADELPKSARPSREVWRDTREHPQPKAKLKEMDEFNQMYKKFKRKFPQASHELLTEKTKQYLEQRKTILQDFQAALEAQLGQPAESTKGLLDGFVLQAKPTPAPAPAQENLPFEETTNG